MDIMNTIAMEQVMRDVREAYSIPKEALDSERVWRLVSLVGFGVMQIDPAAGAGAVSIRTGAKYTSAWKGAYHRAVSGFEEFLKNIANGGDWWAFDEHRRSSKFDEKARQRLRAFDRARQKRRRKVK